MSVNTPSNDPLSIIPTQKTPEVQSSPQTPEVKKEITENEVLAGLLKKYGLKEEEFTQLGIFGETQASLQNLKDSLKAEKKDINLENLVDEAYQEYLRLSLEEGETENFSLDKIGESIGSNRLNKFNEVIDKYFDVKLQKYDFADNSTKEFLKINIYNQLLENGFLNIINTQTGGTNKLFNDILNGSIKLDELIAQMDKQKEGEPKISIVGFDLLNNYLSPCLKKFDEIEAFFKENKIEEKDKKQYIFSNIEFFRDPNNFSKIGEFNVKTIDPKLTTKFDGELNVEELSEMILKSKDLQEKLSDALAGGENSENLIYKLSNNETTGKNTSKLMQMLFKIPLFGKMFAGLLGYDQNNPMLDYLQTSKGYGLYDSLTKLGKHKEKTPDGKEKTVEGKNMFEGIEFQIDFQAEKALFKEVGKTFPELKDKDGYNNFWLKAFGDGYKSNEGDQFSFNIDTKSFNKMTETDKKIDTKEFGELIKDALKNYNDEKNKALNTKPEEETETTSTITPEGDEKPAGETTGVPKTTKVAEETKTTSTTTTPEGAIKQAGDDIQTDNSYKDQFGRYNPIPNNTPEGAIKQAGDDIQIDNSYRDQFGRYDTYAGFSSIEGINPLDPYSADDFKERDRINVINKELTTNAIEFILGNNRNNILSNNFTGVFGNLNQFESIRLGEIINSDKDFDTLIINSIGKGDYEELSTENKNLLREAVRIFYYFTKNELHSFHKEYENISNKTSSHLTSRNYKISGLLNNNINIFSSTPRFKEYINNIKKEF